MIINPANMYSNSFSASRKPKKVYGRPKTRNPFPTNHFHSNGPAARAPAYNLAEMYPPCDKRVSQSRVSSTDIYKASSGIKQIVGNDKNYFKLRPNQGQQQHIMPEFFTQIRLETKNCNPTTNEQQENFPYEVTFYNPKRTEDSKVIEYGKGFDLNQTAKLIFPMRSKPQTTISYINL